MKTDKKTNELNCIAGATVKEEACSESCPTQDHATGNNCEKLDDEDSKNCNRESKLDGMTRISNTTTGSTPVKVETTSCYVSCSLSGGSKSETKAGRNTGAAGESPYMQQQSQIFVFSTMLANKGAEAVLRGQFPSIVAYHSAQLSTKKFLEKFSHKSEKSCNKSTDWLNNLTGTGQKNPPTGTCNDTIRQVPASDVPPFWTDNSSSKNGGSIETSSGNNESSVDDTINKVVNSQSSPRSIDNTICSAASSLQTFIQGVKVPDENLTPQQRQHREEQLATIRNMRLLLFPNRPAETVASMESGQSVRDMVPEGMNSLANSPLDNFSSGVDWDKIQSQLFDVKNKEEVAEDSEAPTSCPGQFKRTSTPNQGAPPSYQSTSRPASVPVGLRRNSSPSSPNDPTSTLSLPSPRLTSAVNSPGESNRHYQSGNQRSGYLPEDKTTAEGAENHSEPGTPVSHSHLVAFSPAAAPAFQKDATMDFASVQSPSVDDILCQTLESVSHEHQEHVGSATASQEANLMPVPSPQQIQYLHSFDGQELTIQKQPNNGLKEEASTIDAVTGHLGNKRLSDVANPCSTKLESSSPIPENMERAFPGPMASPRTPSCGTPNASMDSSASLGTSRTNTEMANSSAPYNQLLPEDRGETRTIRESPLPRATSPPVIKEQCQAARNNDCRMTVRFMGQNYAHGRQPISARRPEHLPLNPNSDAVACQVVRGSLNSSNFDPISSLAQMSQQFANVTSNPGEVQMHPGNGVMIDPQGMHLEITQDIHGSRMLVQRVAGFGEFSGPNPGMPQPSYQHSRSTVGVPDRMRHPSPIYGPVNPASYPHAGQLRPVEHQAARPNVQVKPGAPNTIQYLPAKPNVNSGMPRGPPSLEFLQGFGVPATNFDPRIPTMQNPRYSNAVRQNPNVHGPYPGMVRSQRPVEYTVMYPPPNAANAARGIMMPHPRANAQRMHHVAGGTVVFPGNRPNVDKPYPGDAIPQMTRMPNRMFVPANVGCAPGHRHRPPQPGAPVGNNFKPPTPFVRGTAPPSDPSYAQQYHSFQQQLYATGSRHSVPTSQLNPHMATNSPTFLPDR